MEELVYLTAYCKTRCAKVSVSQSDSPSVASEEGRKSGINHSGGHLDSALDNIDIETILPLMRGYPHADTELSQNMYFIMCCREVDFTLGLQVE